MAWKRSGVRIPLAPPRKIAARSRGTAEYYAVGSAVRFYVPRDNVVVLRGGTLETFTCHSNFAKSQTLALRTFFCHAIAYSAS